MSTPALRVNGLLVGDEFVTSSATTAVPASPWIAPTLLNSWIAFGGGYSTPGYFKDATGRVHLRGQLQQGSAANAIMFTLPAGYRPAKIAFYPGDANGAYGRVTVDASGNVSYASGGSTIISSLDGISFMAEQ